MSRQEFGEKKRERLQDVRRVVDEIGGEKLPRAMAEAMLGIRKEIRQSIAEAGYTKQLSPETKQRIAVLAEQLALTPERTGETAEALERYFDAFRLAHNAESFRGEVRKTVDDLEGESERRTTNFYTEESRQKELEQRVAQRFSNSGFTKEELRELLATCDISKLNEIPLHKISSLRKFGEIFNRFMKGDRAEYIGLSAAMMVPAALEGYAPSLLSGAFKGDRIDATHVVLYAVTTFAAAGLSGKLQRRFSSFLQRSNAKEGGIGDMVSESVTALPPERLQEVGKEQVQQRIGKGLAGYETAIRYTSNDVLAATVTFATSAAMLVSESPILALGTLGGGALTMKMQEIVRERMQFWSHREHMEKKQLQAAKILEEQLNAHMEITLSGMQDDLRERIHTSQQEERAAEDEIAMIKVWEEKIGQMFRGANMIAAAGAALLSGGSPERFIAALAYSGQLQESMSRMLNAKRNIADALIDIHKMELLFNGHAEELRERESQRIGLSKVQGGDIAIKDVAVTIGRERILDIPDLRIPQGAFVRLRGASGAGKTTFMKILAGYYTPTEGRVQWGDTDVQDIAHTGEDALYNAICYLPQFPYQREASVRDNVRFGVREDVDDAAIQDALRAVGLDRRFRNLDEVMKPGFGDVGTASGGESARLGLARTLLKLRTSKARIVFLDEPTGSVDPTSRDLIAKVIHEEKIRRPDVTFVVISHEEAFVQQLDCTMNVDLRDGKVMEVS